MIDYLEHNVSESELIAIFKNNLDRSIFISEYPCFGSDGNDIFYGAFIEKSISKHRLKAQEDAIELSIRLNIFNAFFLVEIKKILYSQRQGIIKLVCLDWLFYFFHEVPEYAFIEINEFVLKHAANDLLKIQSILNILLLRFDSPLIDQLMDCLMESNDPAVFYRLINNLDADKLAKRFSNETINAIKDILISKNTISKGQKDEIIGRLK